MESTTKTPRTFLQETLFWWFILNVWDLWGSWLFGVVLGAAGIVTLLVAFPQEVYRIPKKSQAEKESSGKFLTFSHVFLCSHENASFSQLGMSGDVLPP